MAKWQTKVRNEYVSGKITVRRVGSKTIVRFKATNGREAILATYSGDAVEQAIEYALEVTSRRPPIRLTAEAITRMWREVGTVTGAGAMITAERAKPTRSARKAVVSASAAHHLQSVRRRLGGAPDPMEGPG